MLKGRERTVWVVLCHRVMCACALHMPFPRGGIEMSFKHLLVLAAIVLMAGAFVVMMLAERKAIAEPELAT